jgi:hypothetical protein
MNDAVSLALSVAIMAPVITECAVAWGKPYNVEFASSSSITINYDPGLTSMGEVQNVAQAHCDKYGKDAIPQGSQDRMWKLRDVSFICKTRE